MKKKKSDVRTASWDRHGRIKPAGGKKKNPPDATLRNVQASNKRHTALAARVKKVEIEVHGAWAVGARVKNLEERLEIRDKTLAEMNDRLDAIEGSLNNLAATRIADAVSKVSL